MVRKTLLNKKLLQSGNKRCTKCKIIKSISQFSINSSNINGGGLEYRCKLCKSKKKPIVFIYSLSSPGEGIRYVGKTVTKNRVKEHIREAKRGTKTHKCNWIRKLLKQGIEPILEVIDEVPEKEWIFWEQYWIAQIKSWGFNLVNGTSGGENPPIMWGNTFRKGKKSSEKTKQKIRNSLKNNHPWSGKHHTKNTKDKISIKAKKRFKNIENHPCFGRIVSEEQLEKKYKIIIQYSLDGKFIKKWKSIKSIENELKISSSNIVHCCKGKYKYSNSFIWKYEGDKLNLNEHKNTQKRPVIQYDLKGNKLKRWSSIKEASNKLNIGGIGEVCRGKKKYKTAGGYIWKYEEDKLVLKEHIRYEIICKPIIQLALNGKIIKEWNSIKSASEKYGKGIGGALTGAQKTSKGYKWEYLNK